MSPLDTAKVMRDVDVGSLPICGKDDNLHGMITVRDTVVHCVAEGGDCNTVTAGQMAGGKVFWVEADRTSTTRWP